MVFARDGRTLYFRRARPVCGADRTGRRRRWRRRRRRRAAAAVDAAARRGGGRAGAGARRTRTARQVTYTANIEVDRKALRAQVFNEGWRIMKNRFYDAKMHGVNWTRCEEMYEPLLDYLVDSEELQTRHDDDDRRAQRVAHRRQRRAGRLPAPHVQTRQPGFDVVADASGFYKVGHIYKDGPGRSRLPEDRGRATTSSRVDDRDLKTSRQLLAAPHARRPATSCTSCSTTSRSKDGAWDSGDHAGRAAARSATCSTRAGSKIAA